MTGSHWLATQLAHPTGPVGTLLAHLWNRRNAALNEAALDALDLYPEDHVLEVGFGGGYLLEQIASQIPQGHIAGADISASMVDFCRRRYRHLIRAGRLDIQCAPAESLPFPNERFPKACSVNSIFYWQDVPRALAELGRVLETGGLLVLCFTCPESLNQRQLTQHIHSYDDAEIEEMAAVCGFSTTTRCLSDKHRSFYCLTAHRQS